MLHTCTHYVALSTYVVCVCVCAAVRIHNDDVHTFDFVIGALQQVLHISQRSAALLAQAGECWHVCQSIPRSICIQAVRFIDLQANIRGASQAHIRGYTPVN
jgi:ATP-dependent Clp protease adaptor protein ClpS